MVFVPENFFFGPKKIFSKIIFGPKKFLSKKNLSQNNFVKKKFCHKTFLSKKNFVPKDNFGKEDDQFLSLRYPYISDLRSYQVKNHQKNFFVVVVVVGIKIGF